MAAGKNQLNIHTTYYENFLGLSVSIRVDKHQLMMETPSRSQAPVLRYKDITFTTEYLKESLSAVCPLLGVHNVARVRQGATLPLVEVDFTDEKALERFCKSISDGNVCKRLQQQLEKRLRHEVEVTIKLHLIMPNSEKKCPVSREITVNNHRECISLIRESAMFEFVTFNIADECIETTQQVFGNSDLRDLLQELTEVAAHWYTVGVFLKIAYFQLETIKNDTSGRSNQCTNCLREMLATWLRGTDASPAALVQALGLAGMVGLARKMAVKYGVRAIIIVEPQEASSQDMTAHLFKAFTQLVSHAQGSRPRSQSMPENLHALASQREGIVIKDTRHSDLSDKLRELKESKETMTQALERARSSLQSMEGQIYKLKQEQDRLIEKRNKKKSTKQWLIKQKPSKSEEDLDHLNQLIIDIGEAIIDLSNEIDVLENTIRAQNQQAVEITAQIVQKEQEKEKEQIKMDEVQREKQNLECKLEEDRRKFENEMQKMRNELKLSETREVMMKDELSHKRLLELAQAQSAHTSDPLPEVFKATAEEETRVLHRTKGSKKKRRLDDRKDSEEKERSDADERKTAAELPLTFNLFCFHPVSGKRLSHGLVVHPNELMPVATKKAYEVMQLSPHVPIERCRLVKYDECTDTIYESFDTKVYEDGTFSQIMGRAKNHCSFEILLEICGEGENFSKYNKGGLKLKILVVDIHSSNVLQPVKLRAELGWTVGMLKNEIGKVCSLDPAVMDLMLEIYCKGKHLSIDSQDLRQEDFYKEHNVYARSDLYDHQKPFCESSMKKVVDFWIKSIVLQVTIPPHPRPRERSRTIPVTNIVPYKQDDYTKKEISLRVFRHTTLLQLKTKLEEHTKRPSNCFKVFVVLGDKKYFEMERLNDEIRFSIPSESRLIVQHKKTLKPGEYCVKLYLMERNESEYFKFMMDSIVPANSTVLEFKQQLAKEAQEQGINNNLDPAKMRLRRKMFDKLGLIYLDKEIMNKDIYLYNGLEMFVEQLDRPEPKKCRTQRLVYIRWWHPLSYTVEPTQEITINNATPAELKLEISKLSGIPSDQVSLAKGTDSFPCKLNVLHIEEKLDWNPTAASLDKELVFDDGGVVYFKDCNEKQLILSPDKKAELYTSQNP